MTLSHPKNQSILLRIAYGNHHFLVLFAELKDSFHMLFFRLTNETLSDKRMPDICKLRGGGGWRKTFEISYRILLRENSSRYDFKFMSNLKVS
jgi:hypothetical protein